MKTLTKLIVGATALLAVAPAIAHEGHAHTGLLSGLAHPFTGLDHLLAMLAVGLVAMRREKAFLALPVAFLLFMMVGAGLGFGGVELPLVEAGIAASVLVMGLMLVFAKQLPLLPGIILTGAFALFHGHAHAAEITAGASVPVYIAGFVLGTGLLHGLGFSLGKLLQRINAHEYTLRLAGMSTAAIGTLMLSSSF